MASKQCGIPGLCPICERHTISGNWITTIRRPFLTCDNCNNGMGKFKDDPIFMLKAVAYLIRDGGKSSAKRRRPEKFYRWC